MSTNLETFLQEDKNIEKSNKKSISTSGKILIGLTGKS